MTGCGVAAWFACEVVSKALSFWLPKVPAPSVLPWKKYSCVFARAKAGAQFLLHSPLEPVQ